MKQNEEKDLTDKERKEGEREMKQKEERKTTNKEKEWTNGF